jgi:tetratricopeptide (TPR) repeat protein
MTDLAQALLPGALRKLMPTAPTVSRDPALDAHVFWYRFRRGIVMVIGLIVVALLIVGGYWLYLDRREAAASGVLATAHNAAAYQQAIARYGGTHAAATAYLLLADAQRKDGKYAESNATLQRFIEEYPKHEFAATARLAIAANLESMSKTDEALAAYQRVVADHPKSFEAPLALISEVRIFKAKNQNDAARRACETILTQYRDSIWSGEAMQELRTLKPASSPTPSPGAPGSAQQLGNVPPMLARPPAAPAPSGAAPSASPSGRKP